MKFWRLKKNLYFAKITIKTYLKMKKIFLLFSLTLIFSLTLTQCKKKDDKNEPEPEPELPVDASLNKIDIPPITAIGQQVTVKGIIQNFEDGTIESMDIVWQEDNGTEHTYSVTGLNIGKLGVYQFTHPDVYTPSTSGTHTIKVTVKNVNGQQEDARPANNLLIKDILVASQGVQRTVLYEEFTSSTCSPCANFNSNYFNRSFLNNNQGKYTLIKYQMNWPGSGDPYYTAEGGVRRQYYGVNGVPTLYLDGVEGTDFDSNDLQTKLDNEYAVISPCQLQAYYTIDANNNVKIKVTGTMYLNGNFMLRAAVVEKTTTQNASSNGETEFYNVMMKMVPDANGTSISVQDGSPFVQRIQASLNGTNIEEYSDLTVVVFIQDDQSKSVLQSVYAVEDASQIDF